MISKQLYIVKLSSYIKEQLKFASFLGVEGGGAKLVPPDRGIQPLLDLEIELAQISEKFKNNPKSTLILGGDFNAGSINWDLCTVDHDATNRPLKEKLISILDEGSFRVKSPKKNEI